MSHHPFKLGIGTGSHQSADECVESVAQALDVGYRHVDTAQSYGNERFVRAGIERSSVAREEVLVGTKVHSQNLGYDDVISETEASLERLGVETIDVLYVHWPAHTYDPDETLAAFDELHDRGVVRHVGVCNFTLELLAEAESALSAPLVANQVEYHPLFRQEELREFAAAHEIWLVAYAPLARGRVASVPLLQDIAWKYEATPAQVSIAWLLSKENVAAIPGARGDHVDENWGALDLKLRDADLERIDKIDRRERLYDYEFAPWN